LPSGTVTFLFSDVEGSTRLLEELGAEAYAAALADHRSLVRAAVARHGGVEVDTQGDAFFVAFDRASAGVAAALEVRDLLAAGRLRARLGLHTGEAIVTGEGYVGMDVHRAARIAATGHGGQILVSQSTCDLVGRADVRDLGEHRLKDLGAPERIYQLGEGDFPPLRSLNRAMLPVQPTPLVGRERELTEVADLVRAHRLVTLSGAGGSGKTRLALQAAAELAEAFADGVWFVSLAALRDPELVLPTIARTLGIAEPQTLAEHLRVKDLLLVLDNFEHLLDASVPMARLLSDAPRMRVLVTSRAILRLAAERVYPVPPLEREEGVALFIERARAVLPSFDPDEKVAMVCERLDNLPLAIELAAAQANLLSPAALFARLERRLPLPAAGARDAPARQQTLRATIEWSHDLLTPDAQNLFARLAVFARGWTLEAAEAVCQARLELLAELVDRNLVRQHDDRFSMLETIREYALEQLETSGDTGQLRRSHAEWCVRHAQALYRERRASSAAVPGLTEFELELENFRAALRFLLEQEERVQTLELSCALYDLWHLGGYVTEGRYWLEQGLAAPEALPPLLRARALRLAAVLTRNQGEYLEAERLFSESLSLSREHGDSEGVAGTLSHLGIVCALRGEYERAREYLQESLALREASGDVAGKSKIYHHLANLAGVQGDLATARSLHERSLRLERTIGDVLGVTSALNNLGYIALLERDDDAAEAFLAEGLALSREAGYRQLEVTIQVNLGRLAIHRGRMREAQQLLSESLRALNEYGACRECAECFLEFASIAALCRQPLRAARLLGAAAAVRSSVGHVVGPVDQQMLDRLTTDIRSMLDDDELDAAWEEGEALPFDEKIAHALEPIDLRALEGRRSRHSNAPQARFV
jgi:predicted ATPase/class 3 adenylate cyclase/Flp pilus assembly protein TadD